MKGKYIWFHWNITYEPKQILINPNYTYLMLKYAYFIYKLIVIHFNH